MKIADMLNPKFQASFVKLINCDLDISTAYRLKKLNDKFQVALNGYEAERQQALQDLGSRDESGALIIDEQGTIKIEDANFTIFMDRINQALNKDIEVDQFDVRELIGAKLSANDLLAVYQLIKE